MIPPFFASVLVFLVWFAYERNKAAKTFRENDEAFWEKEYQSNIVRKKSLEHLNYISIPVSSLPFMETQDEKLLECQAELKRLSEKKIVNLTGISNTDLKLTYGTPNLPALTEYDQNFTDFARAVYIWGNRLYELGFVQESTAVLEYGIRCETDISKNYSLLANIYKANGQTEKIHSLISAAKTLNSLSKPTILKILEEILSK